MICCILQFLQQQQQTQIHHQLKIFSQVIWLNSSFFIIFDSRLSSDLDQPFTPTTTSSNDANWGAFVETTKQPTSVLTNTHATNTMSMPTNTFAHPPPEPVRYFSYSLNLFLYEIFRRINMLLFLNYSVLKILCKIINLPYLEIQLTEV